MVRDESVAVDAALLRAINGNAQSPTIKASAARGKGRNTKRAVCVRRLTLGAWVRPDFIGTAGERPKGLRAKSKGLSAKG